MYILSLYMHYYIYLLHDACHLWTSAHLPLSNMIHIIAIILSKFEYNFMNACFQWHRYQFYCLTLVRSSVKDIKFIIRLIHWHFLLHFAILCNITTQSGNFVFCYIREFIDIFCFILLFCSKLPHILEVLYSISNIPPCVQLQVGGHYLVPLALTFRYRFYCRDNIYLSII